MSVDKRYIYRFKTAAGWLSSSSRVVLLVLRLTSSWPPNRYSDLKNGGQSLFLALKLDSKTFPGRNSGLYSVSRGTDLWPRLKLKAVLFLSRIGMATLMLILLSGDVSVNLGPTVELLACPVTRS